MDGMDERRLIDLGVRLLFLGLFAFAAFTIILPLSGIVIWAIILAVAIYPLFDWLQSKLGERRGLAATLITLLGLGLTIGPLWASISGLAEHIATLSGKVQNGTLEIPAPPEGLKDIPVVGPKATEAWHLFNSNMAVALERYGSVILEFASTIGGAVAGIGFQLLAMALSVVVMGMMLPPGPKLGAMTQTFGNRVFAPKGGEFVKMATATVRNVSRGVLGVAALQAGGMGIVMMLFGIDAAGPLAVVILILGILQIGPLLVVIPLLIWAWGAMGFGAALGFTALMIPLTLMDNFLRPIFIAKGLDTPILVILVGVLGGVLSSGLIGIFIGPVILSVFYELVLAWMETDPAKAKTQEGDA
ncbi:AI-2E family transporter [Shimia sp. R11_0]|uniref:AI-2E family transporter n=1 Tax=Shimia sp. R11_0 TaxID=2821096 RepID=UPI001ADA1B4A|nr:AI-2E family transporter [Shimia sp. R11_0]MBO9476320.1 AI-2E family transporter [Shimia sp. R11_0]